MRAVFNKRAFTLIEILTVLVVIGVLIVAFSQLFITNWSATDDRITRAELWQEANDIIETITTDARRAKNILGTIDATGAQQIDLVDINDVTYMTYRVTPAGEFEVSSPAGAPKILSKNIVFNQTALDATTQVSLQITLALLKNTFNRPVRVETSAEIYPRNVGN